MHPVLRHTEFMSAGCTVTVRVQARRSRSAQSPEIVRTGGNEGKLARCPYARDHQTGDPAPRPAPREAACLATAGSLSHEAHLSPRLSVAELRQEMNAYFDARHRASKAPGTIKTDKARSRHSCNGWAASNSGPVRNTCRTRVQRMASFPGLRDASGLPQPARLRKVMRHGRRASC